MVQDAWLRWQNHDVEADSRRSDAETEPEEDLVP